MLTLEWIRSYEGFLSLESKWNKMLKYSGFQINSVFFTFEWAHLWWKHYSSEDWELFILLIKDGERPIALIPMVRSRRGRIIRIQLLGCESLEYQDLMITEQREKCLNLIFDFLTQAIVPWDILSLNRISVDSPNMPFFEKLSKSKGRWARLEEFERAPYIKIGTDWNEFYNTIKNKIRNDTRRQMRRLNQLGDFYFDHCKKKEDIPILMMKMMEYKNQRYTDTGKKGGYIDERKKEFHFDLAKFFWEQKHLDLSFLKIDGNIVGVHFGYIYDNKFYYQMPAFNPKYSRYSPGRILLMQLVQRSFEQGLTEFDFGFGEEPYKVEWAKQDRLLYRFLYFNRNPKGLLLREWFQTFRGFVRQRRKLNSISRVVENFISSYVFKIGPE